MHANEAWCKEDLDGMGVKFDACQGRPYWPRVSFSMAARLYGRYWGREDYFPILDELDFLEGRRRSTRTKEEGQFRKLPLYPFFHKHFSAARHLPRNVAVRWGIDEGRSGNRDLNNMIERVACEYGEDPDEWPARLVHEFVMEAFSQRAQQRRLTGDWIIFSKFNGQNYYLGVVDHDIRGGDDDQHLYDWLRMSCEWEYPFLF